MKYNIKLRFPEFTDEWEEKKLGEISKITMGQSPSSKNYTENTNDTILIQGNADLINGRIVPRIFTTEITKMADFNDIIMTVRAPVGDLAINEFKACIGRGVCTIKSHLFIYFFLQQFKLKNKWLKYSQGSTIDAVSSKDIKELKIKVPALKEQKKITNFLIIVDEKINLLEDRLELFKDFKKFCMEQLFAQKLRFKNVYGESYPNWAEKKLSEIGIFLRGHSYSSENVVDDGLLVLRSNNIQNNDLDFSKQQLQFVNKKCKEELNLLCNDIVICMANGTKKLVGKSAKYKGRYSKPLTVGAFCSIFRSNLAISQYILQSISFKKYLYILLAGTNINNLKNSDLENFKLKIPNLEEQDKIVNFLTNIDEKINKLTYELEHMNDFKKGLLQQMFI